MKMIYSAGLMALLLPLAGPALAQDNVIEVHDAYVRSTNPKSGAAFMQIHNSGAEDCQLIAAATDAAGKAELHTHIDEDGVMKMVHVEEGFTVPAGGDFTLDRGGAHVMLMDLPTPLADGDEVVLSLDFGACGQQEVTAEVDNDRKPGAHDHDHDDAHDSH